MLWLFFVAVDAQSSIVQYGDTQGVDATIHELGTWLNISLRYQNSGPLPRKRQGASMGAKFRNFRRAALDMYWDDSRGGTYSGQVPGLGRTATNTYVGHSFFFKDKGKEVARFKMGGTNLYIIEPEAWDEETRRSQAYRDALDERAFMEKYERESGLPWLSYYPRDPPVLNVWPADYVGQTHVVYSEHGYYHPVALRLTVVSRQPQGPRVLIVKELLSELECDHIVELGKGVVRQSMVGQGGGFESKTRTSQNGWLRRTASPMLDNIYKRFGDVLGIDDTLLTSKFNAEELQVVRYNLGQEYAPHHDFGDDGTPQQRFLTLLLYIQLPANGGATSFPKAFDGRGLEVLPARGDAVLFYNMLPDGNADDLALHSGMPIKDGQKWVCNLWVWDPHR